MATGRIAWASSLRLRTATPSSRAIRLRLKSLVMMAHPLRLAVRTRWASISPAGAPSSSVTWRLIDGSFCISVSTSRPRRPRRRRVTSAESATACRSRKTEQSRDHQSNDDAQQSAEQVRQRSARQPEVDLPPPAEQVWRAEIGKDQTFQGRQPDDRPARARVAPDHEITEQKTTDHSEPH